MPVDTLATRGYSNTEAYNHRFNARLEWKISDRLFMRPFFYDLTNSKQEHDRSSCSIISTE